MKISALVTIVGAVLVTSSIAWAQQPKAVAKKATQSARTDTLVIEARLVEIPGTFPPNDLYNYVYMVKYRVLSVVKGQYTQREILVGQYNPRIPRTQIKDKMDPLVDGNVSKFCVGDKHRLVLIQPIENVWKDAVEDEYFDSELPKFYALKTDVVP